MTIVGPLTTTFRAASSCTTATPQVYQVWSGAESSYVEGPLFTSGSDCFPSGYDPAPANYYSPGWCPYGYTTACSSLASVSTETETAVICCPTHFSYTCVASASQGQAALGCTTAWAGAEAVIGVTVVTDGKASTTTVVSETSNTITAYGIQVRFKPGDPTPVPTINNPPLSTIARTSIPSLFIPTDLLVPTQLASSSASSGVSTPAAIGIGVGSAVAALLLAGAIGLFLFLRRRRKRRSNSSSSSPPPVPPKELPWSPVPYRTVPPPYELSEETSPRAPSMSFSKRHLSMSPVQRWTPTGKGVGGDSGALAGCQAVELEAPSERSLRDRASPGSESSGWTDRQARGGTMPTPWI
ncbi:hypothetical protein N657DRAFT_692659 [Parathielavia appendiculata]|uniref:Uncharacterized protein n=1 Tax=Parathielavia appendiculata TaxID=2587402 RepID=A0AAN6TUL2_9PEZI|nr:hypothetical protein N657DRAFT_692659 [Parathielavia appendiculata]